MSTLLLSNFSSLYVLHKNLLSHGFFQIFPSPSVAFCLIKKNNPSQIRFILEESSILILSFMDCDFDVVSKKLSPNPNSSRFSLILFSRNYVVLSFIFRSMTIVCYLF